MAAAHGGEGAEDGVLVVGGEEEEEDADGLHPAQVLEGDLPGAAPLPGAGREDGGLGEDGEGEGGVVEVPGRVVRHVHARVAVHAHEQRLPQPPQRVQGQQPRRQQDPRLRLSKYPLKWSQMEQTSETIIGN